MVRGDVRAEVQVPPSPDGLRELAQYWSTFMLGESSASVQAGRRHGRARTAVMGASRPPSLGWVRRAVLGTALTCERG
jgi:hypothetical protein